MNKYNFQEDVAGDWLVVENGNHIIAWFKEKNHAVIFTKLLNKEWSIITIKAEESGLPELDCTLEDILEGKR